ncbi:MAG: NmrA family protein [Promethearchaeota archaeon]|nr:MAG: NmrA family protein [Candidatus Lokiarchaeota archaeon]
MEETIVVTCAAGNVGSEISKRLKESGVSFTTVDIENVREMLEKEYNFECLNFEDPKTYEDIFTDRTKKMFLNRPPHMIKFKDSIFPTIDYAINHGVKHIIFLSMIGVNKRIPHFKIERYLKESGINYTFLRCSFFMQNLSNAHREIIKKDNDLLIPAGKGKISYIDVRDVAEIAAKILIDSSGTHYNKIYNLTGKEVLDFYEVASLMTEILGRKITYSKPSRRKFTKEMRQYGFPKGFIKVMKMIYFIVRLGKADTIYNDAEELLERSPLTMEQYIKDYAECWK